MKGTITTTTYYIGWGSATGTVSKAATAIDSPYDARVTAASSILAYNQMQWTATMTASATRSITVAGLFHNNSGTLLIYGDFATVPLAENDRISWTITLASS
jgi:hypothetical protein